MMLSNIHRLKNAGIQTFTQPGFKKVLFLNGLFLSATYYCVMRAYELGGEVSRMYPIQQLESVILPLLGIVFLKERKHLYQKVIAAIIAFIGVLLIRL